MIEKILEFIFDKKKIHQITFILPLVVFYLTNQPKWLFLISLIILAVMEVYKIDLENKINLIIQGRIKQISKKKPLLRNWRDQMKDACKEFNYIYSWPLFGLVSLVFIAEFIYSTCLSYNYSFILFGVHIFLIIYFIFLERIVHHNFEIIIAKKENKK